MDLLAQNRDTTYIGVDSENYARTEEQEEVKECLEKALKAALDEFGHVDVLRLEMRWKSSAEEMCLLKKLRKRFPGGGIRIKLMGVEWHVTLTL